MTQQFDAGKLGIWLFLVTEVLFFSGLFTAYVVYRSNHPEIFKYAHEFLDKKLGALNTAVLLFSSLTMAWAVRAAQLSQKKLLVTMLSLTLACAGMFLVVKYFEYTHKFHMGLYWAGSFKPDFSHEIEAGHAGSHDTPVHGTVPLHQGAAHTADPHAAEAPQGAAPATTTPGVPVTTTVDQTIQPLVKAHPSVYTQIPPRDAGLFFSIYYAMTGLHAIHILAGMGLITWLIIRASKGHFSSEYFGPVDYVGLYWHLVDLIWIYLFPLLYLIK